MGKRAFPCIVVVALAGLWAWAYAPHASIAARLLGWTVPVNLSQSAASSLAPDIALDAGGRLIVAWVEGDIYGVERTPAGVWSAPANLSHKPEPSAVTADPVLAAGVLGGAHLAWYEDSSRTAGNGDIMHSWRLPAGGWEAPLLATSDFGASLSPDLFVDAGGAAHLVWENFYAIYYAMRPPGGAWSSETKVAGGTNFCHFPSVAVDKAGNVHVVWQWDRDQFNRPKVFYSMRPPGGAWSEPLSLSGSDGGWRPVMTITSDGALHVVWTNGGIVYANKPSGGEWSAPAPLFPGDIGGCDLAAGPAGDVHMVWKVHQVNTFYANRAAGGVWSAAQPLPFVGLDGENAAVAVDAQGLPHIVWQTGGSAPDIYYSGALPSPATPTVTASPDPTATPTPAAALYLPIIVRMPA